MHEPADYQIIERLAGGRATDLRLAIDPEGHRRVLKRARELDDPRASALLEAEARALSAICHDNVVRLLGAGPDADGRPTLVLEHVAGPTLAAVIAQYGPAPWPWAVGLLATIARGLSAVHDAGYVHGDLTPTNVLCIDFAGYEGPAAAKLIDFGLAEPHGLGPATSTVPAMGTQGYVAPERLRGERGDPRSDLYAVGVLAFELLTGKPPGDGPAPTLAEVNPTVLVPIALERVIAALLASAPERRPSSAEQLAGRLDELREATQGSGGAAIEVQLAALANRVRESWLVGVLDASTRGLTLIPQARLLHAGEGAPAVPLEPHVSLSRALERSGGRLQIIGPAGYGKTTQLLKLGRELLDQHCRERTRPVPVVFSMSAWRASDTSLAGFMARQLASKYGIPWRQAATLVEQRRIVPLLDALDEAPTDGRAAAVQAIAEFLDQPGRPALLLTYRDLTPDLRARLVFPATVELCPLDAGQAARFLGGEWQRLKRLLEQDEQLQQLAHTPMLLQLMRVLVREEGFAGRDPADEAPVSWLFRRYLDTVFASPRARGVDSQRVLPSVAALAQTLEREQKALLVLEELQPSALDRPALRRVYLASSRLLVAGLLCVAVIPALVHSPLDNNGFAPTPGFSLGLVVATTSISGLGFGLWTRVSERWRRSVAATFGYGTLLGGLAGVTLLPFGNPIVWVFAVEGAWVCAAVLGVSRRARSFPADDIAPVESLRWDARGIPARDWALLGLGGFAAFAGIAAVDSVRAGAQVAALVAAIGTAALASRHVRIEQKIAPNLGIHRSLRSATLAGALGLGVTALVLGWSYGAVYALQGGLFIATLCALWFGGVDAIQHYLLRALLAAERSLPLRLAALDHAVDLGFMRRVGNGWMFAHSSLRDYLAGRAGER